MGKSIRQQARYLAEVSLAHEGITQAQYLLAVESVAKTIEPLLRGLSDFLVLGAALTIDGKYDQKKAKLLTRCMKSVRFFSSEGIHESTRR